MTTIEELEKRIQLERARINIMGNQIDYLIKKVKEMEDIDICRKCKKNKATINYANSVLELTHGFGMRVCEDCYRKIVEDTYAYKKGKADALKNEKEFLKDLRERMAVVGYFDVELDKRLAEINSALNEK